MGLWKIEIKKEETITQVTLRLTWFDFWPTSTSGVKEKVSLTKESTKVVPKALSQNLRLKYTQRTHKHQKHKQSHNLELYQRIEETFSNNKSWCSLWLPPINCRGYLVSNDTILVVSKSNKWDTFAKNNYHAKNERHVLMSSYFYIHVSRLLNFDMDDMVLFDSKYYFHPLLFIQVQVS